MGIALGGLLNECGHLEHRVMMRHASRGFVGMNVALDGKINDIKGMG